MNNILYFFLFLTVLFPKNLMSQMIFNESLKISPNGDVAYIIGGNDSSINVLNIQTGEKTTFYSKEKILMAYSISDKNSLILLIAKSGKLILSNKYGEEISSITINSCETPCICGSLSKDNNLFFVGFMHFQSGAYNVTYKIFDVDNEKIKEEYSFNKSIVGTIVQYSSDFWFLGKDVCEKLKIP